MTSKEVIQYIEKEGIDKLYKKYLKCFELIDRWSDIFIEGDLLNENELALALDQSTGIFAKLCSVVNALEAYKERREYDAEAKFYNTLDKVRTQDTSIAKANARASVSDIREYIADFKSYLTAAQQNITTSQSRLKRLTVEKGAKGVDFTGETPIEKETEEEFPDLIKPDEPIINEGWES